MSDRTPQADLPSWRTVTHEQFDALKSELAEARAENERLRQIVRLREESQIPMIPTGAQKILDGLTIENDRLAAQVRTLTEALTRIASCDCQIACDRLSGYARCASCIARDALASVQQTPAEEQT